MNVNCWARRPQTRGSPDPLATGRIPALALRSWTTPEPRACDVAPRVVRCPRTAYTHVHVHTETCQTRTNIVITPSPRGFSRYSLPAEHRNSAGVSPCRARAPATVAPPSAACTPILKCSALGGPTAAKARSGPPPQSTATRTAWCNRPLPLPTSPIACTRGLPLLPPQLHVAYSRRFRRGGASSLASRDSPSAYRRRDLSKLLCARSSQSSPIATAISALALCTTAQSYAALSCCIAARWCVKRAALRCLPPERRDRPASPIARSSGVASLIAGGERICFLRTQKRRHAA